MAQQSPIVPCLWFDGQAESAGRFYTSVFPNSRVTSGANFGEEGQEITGGEPGSVMVVNVDLNGNRFTLLNGGPQFTFNEAVSFQIFCEDQAEVDHYWNRLGEGGDARAQQCGWLKDQFGVSWQVIPRRLIELISDPDEARRNRAINAMLQMKKIDIAELERATDGVEA